MSRGCFAAEVGVPRLLKLFKEKGIRTSFFIPGHSLDSFPKEMAMVRDAGHEIGLHGALRPLSPALSSANSLRVQLTRFLQAIHTRTQSP